jgi:hypothetical protein
MATTARQDRDMEKSAMTTAAQKAIGITVEVMDVEVIGADPCFAEPMEVLRTLEREIRRKELLLDSGDIEKHLDRVARDNKEATAPRFKPVPWAKPGGGRADTLRARLKRNRAELIKLEKEREKALAAAGIAPKPKPSVSATAVATALTLIRDGVRPERRDWAAERSQLQDDIQVCNAARQEQQLVVDAVRDKLSFELAVRLRSEHRAMVLKLYRALQATAKADAELRTLRASILKGGYLLRHDVLPQPTIGSTLVLGDESEFDSEISRVRRQLEQMGILT